MVFFALALGGVAAVVAILAIVGVRLLPPRKDMATLAELSELKEEVGRLREENERLKQVRDAKSTDIKE